MNFTIQLTAEHVNTVLTGLSELKHGIVRPTFDHILGQIQQQEAAAQAAKATPAPSEAAGLTD